MASNIVRNSTRGDGSSIKPLPQDVIDRITSSKQITSLQEVVLGLLENSLDAAASKIDISVDITRGSCSIDDDGHGIVSEEFLVDGGLFKRHHTSKHGCSENDLIFHSSNGEFLASLSTLSLITITSQRVGYVRSASVSMHQGKVIARSHPAPSDESRSVSQHGTRVSVIDLFGNMPVRLKQRAVAMEDLRNTERFWHALKHEIVAMVLAWERPCRIRLSDVENKDRSFALSATNPAVSHALTSQSLRIVDGAVPKFSLLDRIAVIFQAGLAAPASRHDWVPVSASTLTLSVKGVICLKPVPTRSCQFVSLGIHPCSTQSGHDIIFETINKLFAESSFGVNNLSEDGTEVHIGSRRLNGRKGVDRWPMFVLNVKAKDLQTTCRPDMSGDGLIRSVLDVLTTSVREWLSTHLFRPRKVRRRQNETRALSTRPKLGDGASTASTDDSHCRSRPLRSESPSSHRSSRRVRRVRDVHENKALPPAGPLNCETILNDPFAAWTQIKYGVRKPANQSGTKVASTAPPKEADRTEEQYPPRKDALPTYIDSTKLPVAALMRCESCPSSEDYGSIEDGEFFSAEACTMLSNTADEQFGNPTLESQDPVTKKACQLDSRTGMMAMSAQEPGQWLGRSPQPRRSSHGNNHQELGVPFNRKPFSLSRRPGSASKAHIGQSLPDDLKHWQNPVYTLPEEQRIPALQGGTGSLAMSHGLCSLPHGLVKECSNTSSLSRNDLAHAKIIGQVDKKFILCLLAANSRHTIRPQLVLVDQHAASERIILERLFADLCRANDWSSHPTTIRSSLNCTSATAITVLEPSLTFEICQREHELFKHSAATFAIWGILYDLSTSKATATASQVRTPDPSFRIIVRALPPTISERCRLTPRVLIDLLRREAWSEAEPTGDKRARTYLDSGQEAEAGSRAQPSWLTQIGKCPRGIIELLNSRACRSAIMFNDELSREQCEELISDLSRCTFPFICAHGRVSIVPLVNIGADVDTTDSGLVSDKNIALGGLASNSGSRNGFGKAYRQFRSIS